MTFLGGLRHLSRGNADRIQTAAVGVRNIPVSKKATIVNGQVKFIEQQGNALLPRIGQMQRANTAGTNERSQRYGAFNKKEYGEKPCWRQTKNEQVDQKVTRLFENYKLID